MASTLQNLKLDKHRKKAHEFPGNAHTKNSDFQKGHAPFRHFGIK